MKGTMKKPTQKEILNYVLTEALDEAIWNERIGKYIIRQDDLKIKIHPRLQMKLFPTFNEDGERANFILISDFEKMMGDIKKELINKFVGKKGIKNYQRTIERDIKNHIAVNLPYPFPKCAVKCEHVCLACDYFRELKKVLK